MSEGSQHREALELDREEHAVDGGVVRRRVGLFAKDGLGGGVLELSAISTASGAVLSTTPAAVSVNATSVETVFIGTPTLYAVVNTAAAGNTNALATLLSGPNQIGSVTVSNPLDIRSILSAPTLNVVTQDITVNTGMLTLFPGPNQIGSVTISNTPNVNVNNLLSLASGQEVRSLATILNWPTSLTSLASGTEVRSLTTLLPRTDYIGLVSVSGNVVATGSVGLTGLVSLASGTEIRSLATLLNQPALVAGTAQIGSVTISNQLDIRSILSAPTLNVVTQAITVNTGMLTIFPGPNYIGLVTATVANTIGNATLNPSPNFIGIVTIANPASVAGMITLFPGPSQIGSVTVSNPINIQSILSLPTAFVGGTVAVTQSGTWDEVGINDSGNSITVDASNLDIRDLTNVDVVTAELAAGTNNIGDVDVLTLPAIPTGANYIGLVTASIVGTVNTGMLTIFPGPNQIGSVTVSNVVSVAQSGTWDEVGINDSGNSITIDGNVGILGLLSLASGTEVRSLTTILPRTDYIGLMSISGNVVASGTVGLSGLVSLASGTEVRSLATIVNQLDIRSVLSTATLFAVVNTGAVGNTNALATLLAGPNQIGSVTVSNFIAPNIGNVTLNASNAYVGLTTNYPARSLTTYYSGYVSASGYSTIAVPPSGQRFFIHTAMVNSMGVANGFIGSSTNAMIPFPALATYGGFVDPNDNPGLMAPAVDQSLTIRQYSLVTISYKIPVHFE